VVTHEHAQTDGAGKPEALVISIPDSDRESASIEARFEIDHAKHFHTVFRYRELLTYDADMATT
jgi:hypothetical protein